MDDHEKRQAALLRKDADGVRITSPGGSRSTWLYKALVLVLIASIAGYLVMKAIPRGQSPTGSTGADDAVSDVRAGDGSRQQEGLAAAASAASTSAGRPVTAQPAQAHDPNDLSNLALPGQPAPKMGEVIDELHKVGIHSGLGAFPPPGTSPPLIGLAVPDDYALPEGYVRHSQATDDGQRIEAILMYSPDFEFFDSSGKRSEIPGDRVVPAHLAPPGLPIRPIRIPAPLEAGSPPV